MEIFREYLKKYAEYIKDSYKVEINIISIFMQNYVRPVALPILLKMPLPL